MVKDKNFYKRISKIGLKNRWKKQHEKVKINKILTKEKMAINAYLCGDGWISARKDKNKAIHYEIRFFIDDFYLAKRIVGLFKKEFNLSPKIIFKRGCYHVQIKNKPACLNLLNLGNYRCKTWNIPKIKNNLLLIEWIKCFFDCESNVDVKRKLIQVKSTHNDGLKDICSRLKTLSINSKVYGPYQPKNKKHSAYSILLINGKDLLTYKNLINFYHPIKKKKLDSIS